MNAPNFRRFAALLALLALFASLAVSGEDPVRFGPVELSGAQVKLRWSGGTAPFQLEGAADPSGPWLPVGTAGDTTAASVSAGSAQRYFRVAAGSPSGEPSEAVLRATLGAVGTYVASVPRADPAAWRTSVLEFLKSRPDIDSSGESESGVWAITADGIPLSIWNNRGPDPAGQDDGARFAALAGTDVPGKDGARFAVTVGNGFTLASPRLSGQLAGNAYAPSRDAAPLDSLKGQRNESIFFFNTHGGDVFVPQFGKDGKPLRGTNNLIVHVATYGL